MESLTGADGGVTSDMLISVMGVLSLVKTMVPLLKVSRTLSSPDCIMTLLLNTPSSLTVPGAISDTSSGDGSETVDGDEEDEEGDSGEEGDSDEEGDVDEGGVVDDGGVDAGGS